MKYTSTSKPIIEIKNLNFFYPLDIYQETNTIRDIFISTLSTPFTLFNKKKEFYHVLKDITFNIYAGERIGILGVNGAGKTTLCRCIANILKIDSGTIIRNVPIRSIFNTSIGVLPELTGRENAFLLAKLFYPTINNNELKKIIEDAINFSELGEFINVPFKSYSKGMQARLCLSLISARPAGLLILDEILDGADQFFKKKINQRMKTLISNSQGLLFVSHSTEQIREICNKIIIINKNRIIFHGKVNKGIHIYNLLKQD